MSHGPQPLPAVPSQGQRVLVLGLGATGLSAARWCAHRGARVRVLDTRAAPPALPALRAAVPQAEVTLGPWRAEHFSGARMAILSPGVPRSDPEVQRALATGLEVIGDVELFARALAQHAEAHALAHPRVLAITGSNGKSTVTAMAGALCAGAGLETLVAGNIGLPVLDALADMESGARPWPQAVVLELSSFQLESTRSLAPDAATILNLSEDHLDRYGTMQAYGAAKAGILRGARVQVVNRDDPWTQRLALPRAPVWSFGLGVPGPGPQWGLLADGEPWLAEGTRRILPVSRLRVAGLHNAANALAALALCRAIGLEYERLVAALTGFEGLPHRVQLVAELRGRRFFDDSKGTNVGATVAALNGMREPVVLIAGGEGKGQDFAPLARALAGRVRTLVLIGRDAELIARAAAGSGVAMMRAASMEEAVQAAFAASRTGDAVLLSPACASFDMFRDYEHRAEMFRAAVHHLEAACPMRA
jgi:UDP-N-acetylmuramoylalanine--D-glutamate ligase